MFLDIAPKQNFQMTLKLPDIFSIFSPVLSICTKPKTRRVSPVEHRPPLMQLHQKENSTHLRFTTLNRRNFEP